MLSSYNTNRHFLMFSRLCFRTCFCVPLFGVYFPPCWPFHHVGVLTGSIIQFTLTPRCTNISLGHLDPAFLSFFFGGYWDRTIVASFVRVSKLHIIPRKQSPTAVNSTQTSHIRRMLAPISNRCAHSEVVLWHDDKEQQIHTHLTPLFFYIYIPWLRLMKTPDG